MLDILVCKAEIAAAHGLDAAVMMHNIVYWVSKNKAEGRHFHDGRYWTYNSIAGLHQLFPMWSQQQIRRLLAKCEQRGLLLTGQYGKDPMDHTKWYAPSDAVLALYGENDPGDDCGGDAASAICQNRQIDLPESADDAIKTDKSYIMKQSLPKVTNTPLTPQGGKRKAHECIDAPDWKPDRFTGFWDFYPSKGKRSCKQQSIRAWDKLKPDDKQIAEMGRWLQCRKRMEDWRQGVAIPYASTFLNQRRWEDWSGMTEDAAFGADDGSPSKTVERPGDYEI